MASVIVVRPDGTSSTVEVTDNPNAFLRDVYAVIGNGCDFVEHLNLGDGLHMLFDEEPFRRDPVPRGNVPAMRVMRALGVPPHRIQGAVVFVGENRDGSDLGGLWNRERALVLAAIETVAAEANQL